MTGGHAARIQESRSWSRSRRSEPSLKPSCHPHPKHVCSGFLCTLRPAPWGQHTAAAGGEHAVGPGPHCGCYVGSPARAPFLCIGARRLGWRSEGRHRRVRPRSLIVSITAGRPGASFTQLLPALPLTSSGGMKVTAIKRSLSFPAVESRLGGRPQVRALGIHPHIRTEATLPRPMFSLC